MARKLKRRKRPEIPAKYLIMDARAFIDIDKATVLDMADNEKEAIERAMSFGSLRNYDVAIVRPPEMEVAWDIYGRLPERKRGQR